MRLDLTLAQAAFGTEAPLTLDTYVVCPHCHGQNRPTVRKPVTCTQCHGSGSITQIQHSFLGDIRSTATCPTCQGYGSVITDPCPECSGEGRVRLVATSPSRCLPG